jgi:chromosome segregation ATPase
LSVKIKNQGSAAYKADIYGKSIIVQRHFNRSGTSGFKIQNENGKLISNKKSDLEDILDVFALQLDNPMNVLTQDMARQFLNNSSPYDKYKFFFRGTHLEQLDSDYRILEESVEGNERMMVNLKEATKATKRAFDVAEKKAQMAENQANLHDTYRKYSRQMAWAQVMEQEKLLEDLENDVRNQEEVIVNREQEYEQSGIRVEAATQAHDRAKANVQELEQELAPQKDLKEQATEQFNLKKKEIVGLHTEQRQINQALLAARNAVKNLEQDIKKEEEKLRANDDGSHAQRWKDIEDAKTKLLELQQELKDHSAQSSQVDRAAVEATEVVQGRHTPLKEKTTAVHDSERRLKDLAGNGSNWQRAYPAQLDKLLKAIQNETRFKETPVGPLGRHIALLKPEWSSIIESTSGNLLDGFAVSSKQDNDLLKDLMAQTN